MSVWPFVGDLCLTFGRQVSLVNRTGLPREGDGCPGNGLRTICRKATFMGALRGGANNSIYLLHKKKKRSTFVPHWFANSFTEGAIKRESGANPEQSRCCKFRYCVASTNYSIGHWETGKALAAGTSQKTCHAILISLLSRKKR